MITQKYYEAQPYAESFGDIAYGLFCIGFAIMAFFGVIYAIGIAYYFAKRGLKKIWNLLHR